LRHREYGFQSQQHAGVPWIRHSYGWRQVLSTFSHVVLTTTAKQLKQFLKVKIAEWSDRLSSKWRDGRCSTTISIAEWGIQHDGIWQRANLQWSTVEYLYMYIQSRIRDRIWIVAMHGWKYSGIGKLEVIQSLDEMDDGSCLGPGEFAD